MSFIVVFASFSVAVFGVQLLIKSKRSIDSLKLENINIKNYIDFIKENDELREVINEYMFMLWEKKNLFDFIGLNN